MNCFPCFSSQKTKESTNKKDHDDSDVEELQPQQSTISADYDNNSSIKAFNFRELASATKNFKQESLLGEGSLGKVYKGTIQDQDVAVKQLDRNAMEGSNEFFVEVGQLSLLQHANLVSLVGYCADGDQRLLVYEYMPGGSLQDHLHDKQRLDWVTRMKIAHGTALGLQYLHEKAKPPVIYRDLKSSKVLLDDEFNPKLSNIGLDKLGPPTDSNMLVQSKIRENNGYNAPECINSGTVNAHTDVYSFGVVLLEIISGRKALDTSKPEEEQMLVNWAQPIFKEPKYFPQMADPSMNKEFPEGGLNQAVAMAAMCVQEEASARPLISDLASVLSFLSVANQGNNIPEGLSPSVSSKLKALSGKIQVSDDDDDEGEDEASGNSDEGDERSDNDDDEDDGYNASLTSSSNADRSLDQQQSLKSDRSLSHRSSRRSSSSLGSSRKKSRSDLSCGDEEEELSRKGSGSDASKGNPEDDDDEGNASSTDKLIEESRNDSVKSVDETGDSPGKKSRKKSKDRRSSKKKKKSKDENDSSGRKSGSAKKNHRKAKKHSDNDDDSPGGSQHEN
ncbi:probable serine/threonine-protein kinase PBL25 [Hibiscus syriacus]|uniref:probable serine/threonine-protein kinase PBL25 n=1 Tax=Hibiscus syriacus TaxID=106335 RepID=UPI001922972C|nr:probable serine/threonine-protein kinase PBL25 [Hibiscus syriacus]